MNSDSDAEDDKILTDLLEGKGLQGQCLMDHHIYAKDQFDDKVQKFLMDNNTETEP